MRLILKICKNFINKDYKSSISRKRGFFSVIRKRYITTEKNSKVVLGTIKGTGSAFLDSIPIT